VALLAAVPLDFRDGHALDADLVQRLLDVIQLERFDDGFDFFMAGFLLFGWFRRMVANGLLI
jgi:hypothetical protein